MSSSLLKFTSSTCVRCVKDFSKSWTTWHTDCSEYKKDKSSKTKTKKVKEISSESQNSTSATSDKSCLQQRNASEQEALLLKPQPHQLRTSTSCCSYAGSASHCKAKSLGNERRSSPKRNLTSQGQAMIDPVMKGLALKDQTKRGPVMKGLSMTDQRKRKREDTLTRAGLSGPTLSMKIHWISVALTTQPLCQYSGRRHQST